MATRKITNLKILTSDGQVVRYLAVMIALAVTAAPARAKATAIAWPIPLEAPVTTARRPLRSNGEGTRATV